MGPGFADISDPKVDSPPLISIADRRRTMSTTQPEPHNGIRIACTPCHRKKITCNKKLPCERCARLRLACDERFSGRYKSRPLPQRNEPSGSEEAEPSTSTGQVQGAQSIERERDLSVRETGDREIPQHQSGTSSSSEPQSSNRRVVGLQDLLNKTPAPDASSGPSHDTFERRPLATSTLRFIDDIPNFPEPRCEAWQMKKPPRPVFYRGSYPFTAFEKYLEAVAPEVFEFAHDGASLASDSAIAAGVRFQLSSARYAGIPRIWLYRSALLSSISQHLQSSGEQGYGEEGQGTVSYGMSNTTIISCFTILSGRGSGRHGLVLPTTVGEVTIQWQRPINLLMFRQWREINIPPV
ncbi:hypothetical protein QBC40DRAFT_334141 [Triangularia verruculosa]|uniref:Zn(2)-C6 fungal-type domain-containing protein n=1 Tax=Triangularia verruculosa TaxID=2587418 RepID=A0AAN7AQC4_9PEZI|nr:hypothetical protein QBC40DRAFT_334141 [Triangularia verruculosa]